MPDRPYRQTRRAQSTAATRERIVDAAHRLLASARQLTIEAAAREARVTRTTVYAHFQNREHLREAVLDRLAESGGLGRIPSIFVMTDPVEAIDQVISIFVNFYARHRGTLRRLHAVSALSSPPRARVAPRDERRQRLLTALCKRVAETSEYVDLEIDAAA